MRSIELFAGAGGLALGTTNAGFIHEAVVEWDRDCCRTIRENKARGLATVRDWPLFEMDVRDFDFASIKNGIDLLAGGPPCQPFSMGGKHRGLEDDRNMFPAVASALRALAPKAFIIENVKGILRPSFRRTFEYVLRLLRFPEVRRKPSESWDEHLERLNQHQANEKRGGLSYSLDFRCFNATDFGVPQWRERVFIVGFRSDLEVEWQFPRPSNSLDSLLRDQWVTGEYWERHGISKSQRPTVPERYATRLRRIAAWNNHHSDAPWRTVRDAIADLPDPREDDYSATASNN